MRGGLDLIINIRNRLVSFPEVLNPRTKNKSFSILITYSSYTKKLRRINMNTATATQIKQVENSLEVLNQFGIELDLEDILVEEFERGLANDLDNPF